MKLSLYRESNRPVAATAKRLIALALALAAAQPALATRGPTLAELRAADMRLLRIAEPIMAANASLCDRTMPDLGVSLQSSDQYAAGSSPPFAAPVAFAAVLPGSAAAQAGVMRDDGLLAVDGRPVAKRPELADGHLRDSAFAQLAEHVAGTPLVLEVAHGTERREITIPARAECRALVEILTDDGTNAHSDGRVIQIAYGLAAQASDEQLSVIFAHELGHVILHHRDRLSAAGVQKGLLGGFGRDLRLNIAAEEEADRLSVHLLTNAGLDPRVAPAYWRSKLAQLGRNPLIPHKPSPRNRAKLLDAEIEEHQLTQGMQTYPAELLAKRGEPMR